MGMQQTRPLMVCDPTGLHAVAMVFKLMLER